MKEVVPGQRWISDTELQLGLGTILTVELRTVTVLFLSTGETRTYARQSAPLTRVTFGRGDEIRSHEGWALLVESVSEEQGLLSYHGQREGGAPAMLHEGELDNFMQLNRPADRLFSGQLDTTRWFDLRLRTRRLALERAQSELRGLTGARTSLIPHQLYIAHEVANRYAPRVLLADEVGLGKTIEAGLILHHQLITERARRVLIVVPESLLHQWLVEMLRRFNLHFSLFDEERCRAIEESDDHENPFDSEQLALCSLDFLVSHPERFQQALHSDWDLLVVDEAHHLAWSPEQPSVEYQCVEQLAARTQGVLLLTATPEQLGKASHFARLRLLDPDRFPDFATFVAEEQAYEPVARAVEELLAGEPLSEAAYQTLLGTVGEGDNQRLLDRIQAADTDAATRELARNGLVEHLLDRHGTGRVLFRNTRAAIKGFPERQLHAYPLPLPEAYAQRLAAIQSTGLSEPRLLLCPELLYQADAEHDQEPWTRIDPRVSWLTQQLKQLRGEKVLVIAASADTAIDLAEALRLAAGIHAAVFHEEMSLLERDRAAAFFADREYGSQVLICSEIGSEGRNFQFAHHLVLFDLPINPDLLEQRIGRLDRIGQSDTVRIHVPYLENSTQALLLAWYHDGLNAFEQTCPTGHSVFVQVEPVLREALHQLDEGLADLPALIATTRALNDALLEQLQHGRDRLLEYNSCRPLAAQALRERAAAGDTGNALTEYLETLFDCFGIDAEEHSEHSTIIRPGEQMQTPFPGLPDEGLTFTCDRATALANEDRQFLTWEHPLVQNGMDMVLSSERGNSSLSAFKYAKAKPGSLLVECVYVLESASTQAVESARYLPPTLVRVVVDSTGKDHAAALNSEQISSAAETVDSKTAMKIVRAYADPLRQLLALGEQLAKQQVPALLQSAQEQSQQTLEREIHRMKALQQVNPNVRDDEIAFMERQWQAVRDAIASASLRLDAQRVLIVT